MKSRAAILLTVMIAAMSSVAESKTVAKRRPASMDATAAKAAQKSAGRIGVVTSDEIQIYDKPDLDAKVIAVVKRGTRLPISKGTRGEFAKFYRTRVPPKAGVAPKLGWILTIDVKSPNDAKKFFTKATAAQYKRGPFASEEDESARGDHEELIFKRSVALAFGMSGYKESINGVDYNENVLTYGLKLTGPDVLLTGPLMDVNILLHYGAPSYYDGLSAMKPSGFMLWMDANFLLPIRSRENHMIGIAAGPVLVMSNIKATQGDQNYSMWQFGFGADLELTAGVRIDNFVLRVDAKYIFERRSYPQAQLSLGTIF